MQTAQSASSPLPRPPQTGPLNRTRELYTSSTDRNDEPTHGTETTRTKKTKKKQGKIRQQESKDGGAFSGDNRRLTRNVACMPATPQHTHTRQRHKDGGMMKKKATKQKERERRRRRTRLIYERGGWNQTAMSRHRRGRNASGKKWF